MGIYSRSSALSAVVGILALVAAPGLWAQQQQGQNRADTGTVQTDTSGYQSYKPSDSTKAGPNDTSAMNQGAPSDTALKAKPGVQTGPSAKDSGAAGQTGIKATVDSVVCKDGSRAAKPGKTNCAEHGGVDKAATKAAWGARGYHAKPSENNNAAADTSKPSGADTSKAGKEGAGGYQYNGPSTDTASKAKPGGQTGPSSADSAHGGMSDTTSSQPQR